MDQNFVRLYAASSAVDAAYFLGEGRVYLYASNDDKYAITGKNLIIGGSEIILRNLVMMETGRLETAITDSQSVVKKMSVEKFLAGLHTFSFIFNVCMVLARQVLLTRQIVDKNMDSMEGDEKKTRQYAMEYFRILERVKAEYEKRKLPWLKDIVKKYETSLIYKKGEAFTRTMEPTRIEQTHNLSDRDVEYPRGAIICEQDSFGTEMYILRSGAVEVLVGDRRVTSFEEPGTVVGEMALLLGEKRTATLKAMNNVVITVIRKEDLREIADKQEEVLIGIATALAKRHYGNIMKLESINKTLIAKAMDAGGEEGKKPPLAARALIDLRALKADVEKVAREKDAAYLKDLFS